MRSSLYLLARTVFVLALLAIMPLLALPPVGDRIKALYRDFVATRLRLGEKQRDVTPALDEAGVSRTQSSTSRQTAFQNRAAIPESLEVGDQLMAKSNVEPRRLPFIQQRLKQLGATYTRLETAGHSQDLYRFHCRIPVNNSVYTRTFESTNADPILAMERVLADVQSWRMARNGRNNDYRARDRRKIR